MAIINRRKTSGPAKQKPSKKGMSFRFRPTFAELLVKIATKENLSQVRVIEVCLARYGKDIRLC